jgi:hypothetical protein
MKKIAFFLLFIWSCKTSEVEKPGYVDERLGIEYKSGVVMVEEPFAEVEEVSENKFLLRKSYFEASPKVGEIVVVPGKIMHKVRSISTVGDRYEMVLEPAKLNEVMENVQLDYTFSPEWTNAISLKVDGKELLAKGQRIGNDTLKFKFTVSGIDYEMGISPEKGSQGKIKTCRFIFGASKGGSTSMVAEGYVSLPEQKFLIYMENGKLKNFKLENEGMTGDVELKMVTAGGDPGAFSLKLPKLAITIPVLPMLPTPLGPVPNPIPMSIDVGVQFTSQMTLPDPMSSATGNSKMSFSADGGFTYEDSNVITQGDMNETNFKSGSFDSAAGFGMPVDLQFGLAFPRISLNIIYQEVGYVYVGYLIGSSMEWGPLCKRGYSKVILEGGYKLEALGVSLMNEKVTFVEKVKRANSGCD